MNLPHSVRRARGVRLFGASALLLASLPSYSQSTGFNKAGAGPFDYNDTANWVGGVINGIWDPSLTLTGAQAVTFDADTTLAGGLSFGHAGNFLLTLRATGGTPRTITLGGDVSVATTQNNVAIGSATAAEALNIDLGGADRTFSVVAGRTLTLHNVISNGALTKTDAGTLALNGANTFSGGVTLNAGTLSLGHDNALGTGALSIYGGTLTASANNRTIANAQHWHGDFSIGGSNTLIFSTGPITLHADVRLAANGNTVTINNAIGEDGNARRFIKDGGAQVILRGANTYSGGTLIEGGKVTVDNSGTLGANIAGNDIVVRGAALEIFSAAKIGSEQTLTLESTGASLAVLGLGFNGLPANLHIAENGLPVVFGINTTTFNAITSQAAVGTGKDYLGSSGGSGGTFTGTTLGAGSDGVYRLGGGGSTLTVANAMLVGANDLIVGSALGNGRGTVVLQGANTLSGATAVVGGNANNANENILLRLSGAAGALSGSDISVTGNATLDFDSTASGVTGATRAQSVTFAGPRANLTVRGNAGANSNDVITGALAAETGHAIVTLTPNAARHTQLTAGSFEREAGSTILFRGTNLGVNTLASQTANSSGILFDTAPTLTGGTGANTTDLGIIKGAFGDTVNNGGFNATAGLVTYDAAKGVRLLDKATEYKTSITDGQTQLDNILLTNDGGAGIKTATLNSNTTVNSLSFNASGSGNDSGIVVDGSGSLILNSGVIFATQLNTGNNAGNALRIATASLDLNGGEGVIIADIKGTNNLRTNVYLDLATAITNDGGHGVTIVGSNTGIVTASNESVVRFSGAASNTYTGLTTLNGGVLLLAKTPGVTAIAGDVLINGGAMELGANGQLSTSTNITIAGGVFRQASGNQGASYGTTFNNLAMTGGLYETGRASYDGTGNIQGTVSLSGGTLSTVARTKLNVGGLATFSGGVHTIAAANSTASAYDTVSTFNGGIAVVNTKSGAYNPITLAAGTSATNLGGRLVLAGDLSFTGNGTNTYTASIAAADGVSKGVIALEGIRTFDIGDGAAAIDFALQPALVNGSVAGGLVKTGAGTLALSAVNTYTGSTAVNQGVLHLGVANAIAASSGLTLGGGTLATGFNQTLASLTLTASSVIDLGAGNAALSFADSSGATWATSVTLSIINFTEGLDLIRFGASDAGLTGDQLSRITINGFAAIIDADGYLASAVPEPAAFAILAGLATLGFAGARRRRR